MDPQIDHFFLFVFGVKINQVNHSMIGVIGGEGRKQIWIFLKLCFWLFFCFFDFGVVVVVDGGGGSGGGVVDDGDGCDER